MYIFKNIKYYLVIANIIALFNFPMSYLEVYQNKIKLSVKLLTNYHKLIRFLKIMNNYGLFRLVGGCVRDLILGKMPEDIDLSTTLKPNDLIYHAKRFGFRTIPTGIDHGTVTVLIDKNFSVEVTTLRHDLECYGRKAKVDFTEDFYEDSLRRDFTINALSFDPLTEILFDYFNGLQHLHERRVIFIGSADKRISEDYLRILRFFRFSSYYADQLDEEGYQACLLHSGNIIQLSRERIISELNKIFSRLSKVEYILPLIKPVLYYLNICITDNLTEVINLIINNNYSTNHIFLKNSLEAESLLERNLSKETFINDNSSIKKSDTSIEKNDTLVSVINNNQILTNNNAANEINSEHVRNFLKTIQVSQKKMYLFIYPLIVKNIAILKDYRLSNQDLDTINLNRDIWFTYFVHLAKKNENSDQFSINASFNLITPIEFYILIMNKSYRIPVLEFSFAILKVLYTDVKYSFQDILDLCGQFPIRGQDMISLGFEGSQISLNLKLLQRKWIESKFQAQKNELLDLLVK